MSGVAIARTTTFLIRTPTPRKEGKFHRCIVASPPITDGHLFRTGADMCDKIHHRPSDRSTPTRRPITIGRLSNPTERLCCGRSLFFSLSLSLGSHIFYVRVCFFHVPPVISWNVRVGCECCNILNSLTVGESRRISGRLFRGALRSVTGRAREV